MAGLDDLFSFVLRAVEVTPTYVEERCLVVRSGKDACSACLDACPHDAITISTRVELDAVDCTGCGLCIRACPSEALADPVRLEPAPALRCSVVAGDAPSVRCLAQLSGPDLVRLAGPSESVTLARSECVGRKVGGAGVPEALAESVTDAKALLALHGRELHVNVQQVKRLDAPVAQARVSRRALLGGGVRKAAQGVAGAIAPLEAWLPAEGTAGGPGEEAEPPPEAARRYRIVAASEPEPHALVPWSLPRVADGCILCPACTSACPTNPSRATSAAPRAPSCSTPTCASVAPRASPRAP